jgi:serine/threonine protein kinase
MQRTSHNPEERLEILRIVKVECSGEDICPTFVSGSTVVLSRLDGSIEHRAETKGLVRYTEKYMGTNKTLVTKEKSQENIPGPLDHKKDVHYRFTFMSHVDNATTLSEYLMENKHRLNARLFVLIEHAVLTMWFAGYAHCDLHTENVLIARDKEDLGGGGREKETKETKETNYLKNGKNKHLGPTNKNTNNLKSSTTRAVIIDFGMCIKLEERDREKLKTWWASQWKSPDVVRAYQMTPARVKEYAVRRMWVKRYPYFNWEGNFLQCMAQRLDGAEIVRERVAFYREKTTTY